MRIMTHSPVPGIAKKIVKIDISDDLESKDNSNNDLHC